MSLTLRQEETARRESVPFARFQYVTLTATAADTDIDVPHDLNPTNPEEVRWIVVGTEGTASATVGGWDGPIAAVSSGSIYRDASASRKAWQPGYIWLRAMHPGTFRLLLFLEAG